MEEMQYLFWKNNAETDIYNSRGNSSMKNVLLFGLGEQGKKLIDQYLEYNGMNRILAIADNYAVQTNYRDIPVISPDDIAQFIYDEIWVCTIYYPEIKRQLVSRYGIPEEKILYAEPVMPVLDERLRRHYGDFFHGMMAEIPDDLEQVLEYMKSRPARMYCYPFYEEYLFKKDTPVFYDEDSRLFFSYYEGKKLFLSGKQNSEQKARSYLNAILMEQDRRSPHCYWNGEGMQELTGTGVDVGTAEGIFALKIIEQVEHIYLIEADRDWIDALQHTFAPYRDKVTIVEGFVSDNDEGRCMKLDSLLGEQKLDFIKMDIEGEEQKALSGCRNILDSNQVRLAICVYHRQEDNAVISRMLSKQGYHVENSAGYVVCQGEWELEEDRTDFRKAILFAHKEKRGCDKGI